MARIRDSVAGGMGELGQSADEMSAAVVNVCSWISILAARISAEGINLSIKRTDEGRFAVNISIPPEPKEPTNG